MQTKRHWTKRELFRVAQNNAVFIVPHIKQTTKVIRLHDGTIIVPASIITVKDRLLVGYKKHVHINLYGKYITYIKES